MVGSFRAAFLAVGYHVLLFDPCELVFYLRGLLGRKCVRAHRIFARDFQLSLADMIVVQEVFNLFGVLVQISKRDSPLVQPAQ